MELSYIGLSFVWILNAAEAYVDAHLQEFDINEDISLRISPKVNTTPMGDNLYGISFCFRPRNRPPRSN